jgi:hypothetical protein
MESIQHPISTTIRFTRTLIEPACGDHPTLQYAREGEYGTIVGHGTREGYWVKTDNWPEAFGASDTEFEVVGSTVFIDKVGEEVAIAE